MCAACGLLLAMAAPHAMDFRTAVHKAQAFDPTTQAAQYAFRAGMEKRTQGNALYFPQINATANYNRLHIDSESTLDLPPVFPTDVLIGNASGYLHGFGVTLVQPIYNAAVFAGAAELKDQAELAGLQKQGADANLILRVAQAYFGVLMARDNLELTREQKVAIAQQLASAQARFKAGKTNITDVRDAQARYQGILAEELSAINNLAVQQDQFASIVGEEPRSLSRPSDAFEPSAPEPDDLGKWVAWGRQDNLNVQSARVQLEVNNHEVDKYRLRSRPQLNLVASYQDLRQNGTLPILVAPDHSKQTMVGLQLSVPLFAGGTYNSKYREAVAESGEATYQLQAAVANTDVQVKQQFLNVRIGTQQIAALGQAVVAAKSSLDATTLGLKVGKRTTLDVLNAQQQYFSSLLNLDAARYQYLLSRLNLAALVNKLGEDDVKAINAYLTAVSQVDADAGIAGGSDVDPGAPAEGVPR
ncbi:MAG: TolC family outer membrane protein [Proteobacteria bacterium]|nr:TolC family outer membrane protein [Pseudomonadota bacterium]